MSTQFLDKLYPFSGPVHTIDRADNVRSIGRALPPDAGYTYTKKHSFPALLAEAFAILMQSNASTILANELFIALPYVLTIVLTISRRSFNVPSKLGIAYYEEN